jgi:serine/threonine protein kinase/tetratricopeptide (TPR) repeat protein
VEGLRERFGKYHVLERIAQGGMAEVYKVKTVGIAGFEKVQALKRILPHQAHQGRFIRSFIDEARIAVELNHRNIVQVFDFGKADGELYLAMELIEGKDLRSAMTQAQNQRQPMPAQLASYILSEVGAGLDYAHRKSDGFGRSLGIVHCDVSPSNVMLSTDGYVKILDFGIARASFASALERRRLRGKPRYMAPEQTRGEPPTPATDVFALGIIAWELYAGRALFQGNDLREILAAVRRADVPRLDRINPELPADLVSAVATALVVAPEARGTASDLAGACGRAARGAGARALASWLGHLDHRLPTPHPWHDEGSSASRSSMRSNEVLTSTGARRQASAAELSSAIGQPRGAAPVPPEDGVAEGTPGFDDPAEDPALEPRREDATSAEGPSGRWRQIVQRASRDDDLPDLSGGRASPSTIDTTGAAPRFQPQTLAGVGIPSIADAADAADGGVEPLEDSAILDPAALWPEQSTVAGGAAAEWPQRDLEWDASAAGASISGDAPDPRWTDARADRTERREDADADAALFDPSTGLGAGRELGLIDDPIDDAPPAEQAAPAVERRRIVVVVALVEARELETMRVVTRSLGELAYQRGGVVLSLGERIVVVAFGLEVAGEDDVAIAMAWSLDASAMARDAGEGAPATGQPIVRIGARTGVAVPPGDGGPPRVSADAVDEATALARDAQPDRPLFSGAAGRLSSSHFALREVATRRGLGRRARVLEVIGPRSFDERDRTLFARRGKFVGRAAALARLADAYDQAVKTGERVTALVTGPVGVGKSRLVAELVARLESRPQRPMVITTTCGPASRLTPFSVVIDLYLAALGLPPVRGRAARAQLTQRLLHLLARNGADPARAQAAARDIERAMELRDGVAIEQDEAADLRGRVAGSVADLRSLLKVTGRPSVIVLEDLHQADGASLEVMRLALDRGVPGSELLVLTARPEGPPLPDVDAYVELDDLVGGELRELIVDRLGDGASPLNVAAVIARAGGNPLFVEELAQAVRDSGDALPSTAREVIAARVERLSPSAKAALKIAAVLGGAVRARVLEELVGAADLSAELDELCAEGFLVRADAAAPDADEGELAFARGLVREVVYESMSARAQREAHARIGRLLASRFFAGRDEPPAVVAEHLEQGGDHAGAAAFSLRAGRLALAAFDAAAAVAHFTRTLELEAKLGDPPPTAPSRTRRREALAGREEARRTLGDLTTDAADLDRLVALADGVPARLGDIELRAAQRQLRRGDFAAALACIDRALAQAERCGAARPEGPAPGNGGLRLRGEALRLQAEAFERQARFDEALGAVRSARGLFAQLGAFVDETRAMVDQGRIHLSRGQFEAARDLFRPAVARIHRLSDPVLERVVAIHIAEIQLGLCNYADAYTSATRAVELCRRHGDRAREGDAMTAGAIVLAAVGRYDDASAGFASGLDLLERTASQSAYAECLVHAGLCDARRGHGTGLEMIDEGARVATAIGARTTVIHAQVARAYALVTRGDLRAAADVAGAAAIAARDATLTGQETVALARQARALAEAGAGRVAAEPARRALALLELNRYPAAAIEEVLVSCALAFAHAGDRERADTLRERARQGVLRKLREIDDATWRGSFEMIEENRGLLR